MLQDQISNFLMENFYLLEINTQPGMTKLSLVPEIANHKGINFIKLIELILNDAATNKKKFLFIYYYYYF